MRKNAIKSVVLSTRPNFLVLTFAIVFASFVIALNASPQASWFDFSWVLVAGLIAHAWVNLHNEVTDTENGLDAFTVKTPFSGGTGGMLNNPEAVKFAKKMLLVGLACLFGFLVYFVTLLGWQVLLLAALGGSSMLLYSRYLVKRPLWGGISAGLGFGPALVLGANWVFTGTLQTESILLSLVIFLWVNNLLLLNQVPDWRADQKVGRNNFVIQLQAKSLWIYTFFSLLSIIVLVALTLQITKTESIESLALPSMIWLLFWCALIVWQNFAVWQAQKYSPLESFPEHFSGGLSEKSSEGFSEAFPHPLSEQFPQAHQQLSQTPPLSASWLKPWQRPLAVNVVINILLPLSLAALLILSL